MGFFWALLWSMYVLKDGMNTLEQIVCIWFFNAPVLHFSIFSGKCWFGWTLLSGMGCKLWETPYRHALSVRLGRSKPQSSTKKTHRKVRETLVGTEYTLNYYKYYISLLSMKTGGSAIPSLGWLDLWFGMIWYAVKCDPVGVEWTATWANSVWRLWQDVKKRGWMEDLISVPMLLNFNQRALVLSCFVMLGKTSVCVKVLTAKPPTHLETKWS